MNRSVTISQVQSRTSRPKVLMVSPPLPESYLKSKVQSVVKSWIPLNMAVLSATCEEAGAEVNVLDLNMEADWEEALHNTLASFEPTYVAISFTTGTYDQMMSISTKVRNYNPNIVLIGGGTHASHFPENTLSETPLDIVAVGEGDFSLAEVISGRPLPEVRGIAFKRKDGSIHRTEKAEKIKNLDILPLPAWHLFDIKRYQVSKLISRKHPVAPIETSRGCVFSCSYCNKSVFSKAWTYKSPERVMEEVEHLANAGFKEFHVFDDLFNTTLSRAKSICSGLKEHGFDIPYNLINGVRVNSIDPEFCDMVIESGGYRASFGVESGNQRVLDAIQKGVKVQHIRDGLKMTKDAGWERLGYFIFGLPTEDEKSMQDTIDIAIETEPDFAKATIATPFPGTVLYEEVKDRGDLLTEDWGKFMMHNPRELYKHDVLEWDSVYKYYMKFYRDFYFRPAYMAKRVAYSLSHGTFWAEVDAFIHTDWNNI